MSDHLQYLTKRVSDLQNEIKSLEADLKAERGTGPVMGIEVMRRGPGPFGQMNRLVLAISLDLVEAAHHQPTYLDEIMATMRAQIEREMKARAERKSAG